jgi:hypothetical protein
MNESRGDSEKYLDEIQDREYARAALQGDAFVTFEAALPKKAIAAEAEAGETAPDPCPAMSLSGDWKMRSGAPRQATDLAEGRSDPVASEGVREGWFRPEIDRSAWYDVAVPTSVQSALLQLGEMEDPFWDDNTYCELMEHGAPEQAPEWHFRKTRVEQKEWWFARSFTIPDSWRGRRVRLRFNGIDYAGSFYLNGHSLGYHEGMYGGPEREVEGLLHWGGENVLVVRLDAARDTWHGNMKGSPGWGWHYGHLISTGIWRDVVLEVVPDVELRDIFVQTLELREDAAVLSLEYMLRSRLGEDRPLEVCGSISGKTCETNSIHFRNTLRTGPGLTRFGTQIEVAEPRLWNPLHYGRPDLYELKLTLRDAETGEVLHSKETPFGIRTVEMRPLEGAKPGEHYRWQFVINGVPMFIKGMNWCWTHPMLDADEPKYEQALELAARAGVQMLRCWGGGIVETEEFYRLCDEKGILVYQEFSYCWGPPDFPLTNPGVLDQQVAQVVKRRRNHPSLVMWGGGNENVDISGNDEGLFLVGLRCRQFDPSRPFHRTSPWGGGFHNWRVHHKGLPIDEGFMMHPSPFYGEFGCASMPDYEACLRFLPEEKLQQWPPPLDDGGLLVHMNMFRMGDMVKVMRHGDYGPINDWKTYIEYGQMAQADEIAFATRLQRAGAYSDKGGLWAYKMTELFPGQSWGVLDFYLNPKIAYFRTKQVYAPRAAWLFAERFEWAAGERFEAEVHAANDSAEPLQGALAEVVLYDAELRPWLSETHPVEPLQASVRKRIASLSVQLPEEKARPFLANVRLLDAAGGLLNDQWHWFNFKNKTELVRKMESYENFKWPGGHEEAWDEVWEAYGSIPEIGLTRLPQTTLDLTVNGEEGAGALLVANTGDAVAFNVLIEGFPHEYGAFLGDNSFCLRPGETRKVAFETVEAGEPWTEFAVRAWNAPRVRRPQT